MLSPILTLLVFNWGTDILDVASVLTLFPRHNIDLYLKQVGPPVIDVINPSYKYAITSVLEDGSDLAGWITSLLQRIAVDNPAFFNSHDPDLVVRNTIGTLRKYAEGEFPKLNVKREEVDWSYFNDAVRNVTVRGLQAKVPLTEIDLE